jgi:hypothetical protein
LRRKSDPDVVSLVKNFKAACEAVRSSAFPENRSGVVLSKILRGPDLCPHPRKIITRNKLDVLLQSISNSHSTVDINHVRSCGLLTGRLLRNLVINAGVPLNAFDVRGFPETNGLVKT